MKKAKILYNKRRKKKLTHLNINYLYLIIILFILFIIIIIIYKQFRNPDKPIHKITIDNISEKKFEYFCCFCTLSRGENKYSRELISYYSQIGVKKFIIGDNNLPNTEKFSDILKDYIKNGIVDIIDIKEKSIQQATFFGNVYEKYKTKCEWVTFFDFDEYLVMHFNENKKITLKEYLSNGIFDKCEAILFNWLVYTDNDLVHYDNRTLLKRFTTPDLFSSDNIYVKSIVRGNINKRVFETGNTSHRPILELNICDSMGKKIEFIEETLNPPRFKYAYIMHFSKKTAEEYAEKIKLGLIEHPETDIDSKIEEFFSLNKFTEEKLKVFETKFNRTFEKYHNNK